WQVPVGNQYYLTMNNTCGHYQDNVAPYFIAHAGDLYAAGLIAVLFGAGNACQTNNTDAQGDLVTNNGGAPTTDTLGYCSACNVHASAYTDDDGGYLRTFVGEYYGGWQSLGGILTSRAAVASWGASRADVVVRGTDNGLWWTSWQGASWSSWTALGGILTSSPAVVSANPNQLDVFVRGTDNALWQRTWDTTGWKSWERLGGVLTTAAAASSCASGHLDVFVLGTDYALYQLAFTGSWGSWQRLGGQWTSSPGAV